MNREPASGRPGVRIGIAPDRLERIFEPFVQVGSDFPCIAEGAGLGLVSSRNLAVEMGGDATGASAESAAARSRRRGRGPETLPSAAAARARGGA